MTTGSVANSSNDGGKTTPKEHPQTPQGGSAVEPSGPRGDNPATAGPGHTGVKSETPERKEGHINPSAPEDANTTPGTTSEK